MYLHWVGVCKYLVGNVLALGYLVWEHWGMYLGRVVLIIS